MEVKWSQDPPAFCHSHEATGRPCTAGGVPALSPPCGELRVWGDNGRVESCHVPALEWRRTGLRIHTHTTCPRGMLAEGDFTHTHTCPRGMLCLVSSPPSALHFSFPDRLRGSGSPPPVPPNKEAEHCSGQARTPALVPAPRPNPAASEAAGWGGRLGEVGEAARRERAHPAAPMAISASQRGPRAPRGTCRTAAPRSR